MTKTMPSWLRYVVVWIVLLGLTLLSWLISLAHLGGTDIAVALVIAVVKASLVGIFFMHLGAERFSVRMIPAVAAFFVALLVVLVALDVATRRTYPKGFSPNVDEIPALPD